MRITCPSCGTQYDVDENDIAFSGQEVQCSECQEIWIQKRDGSVLPLDGDEASEIPGEAGDDTPASVTAPTSPQDSIAEAEPPKPEDRTPEESPDLPDAAEKGVEDSGSFDKTEDAIEVAEIPEVEGIRSAEEIMAEMAAATGEDRMPEETSEVSDAAATEQENEETTAPAFPPIQEAPALVQEAAGEIASDAPDKPWEQDVGGSAEASGVSGEAEAAGETADTSMPEGFRTAEEVMAELAAGTGGDDDKNAETSSEQEVKLRLVSDADGETGDDSPEEDPFDEEALLETFRTQIKIEDELEANPPEVDEDVTPLPEELIGRRARSPNLDALRSSVRAGATATSPAATPQGRFRRGFILPLLLLAIVSALYVFNGAIAGMVPAAEPALGVLVAIVDVIRNAAAGVGNLILGLVNRG